MHGIARIVTLPLMLSLAAASVSAQTARDVVVIGMEAEPPGLDPGQALGLHTLRVTHEMFETLVTTPDDSTEVVPGLAASWQASPDGLAWTFNNPEVDQLLVQARQVADRAKRAELYRRAQRIIVEDAPWIFVDHEVQVVATRANLKGFKLHPSGFDLRVESITRE